MVQVKLLMKRKTCHERNHGLYDDRYVKTVLTYGTGTAAAIPGVAQAGKTGTSNYTDEELAKIGENTAFIQIMLVH